MRELTEDEVKMVSAGSAFGSQNGPYKILDGGASTETKFLYDNGDGTGTLRIVANRGGGPTGTPGFDDDGMITYQMNTNVVGGTLVAAGNYVSLVPGGSEVGNAMKALGSTIIVGGWLAAGSAGGANIPQYMPVGPGAAVGGPF
jgi:hypothetical protein